MLRHHRRLLFPVLALLLTLPLLVQVLAPPQPIPTSEEMRVPAPPPRPLRRMADLPDVLREADAWLRDHFGFRAALIHAQSFLAREVLHSGNERILIGRDDWFFLLGIDESLAQSAGVVVRPERVAATADLLADMRRVLAARGIKLLVASPPSSATLYPEELPDWARNPGRPTHYDLLYAALAERGVPAVDLRPALRAEKPRGHVSQMHDSHWSPLGALAAFNAVVDAAGLPDWRMTPETALAPLVQVHGGDSTRLLGVAADETEPLQALAVPAGVFHELAPGSAPTGEIVGAHAGPTIMVIGDSFTRNLMSDLVAARAGRFVWVHHQSCGFDWKWIDIAKPAQVWYMPAERLLLCAPGRRPAGFAAALSALAASQPDPH